MLTVNHKSAVGEVIYEVESVHYRDGNGVVQSELGLVNGGDEITLRSGSVFVMNSSGKTVAKYDLGDYGRPISAEDRNCVYSSGGARIGG